MGNIYTPKWDGGQPQPLTSVDYTNPLTRGLLTAINLALGPQQDRRPPTTFGGTRVARKGGMAVTGYSAGVKTQYAFDPALANGCVTAAGCSVFLLVDVDALTNYGGLISLQDTTTTKTAFEIRLGAVSSTDSQILAQRASASTYAPYYTPSNQIAAGDKVVPIVITWADNYLNTQPSIYVKGMQGLVGSSGSGAVVAAPTTNGLCLGGRSPDNATILNGAIYAAAIWGRGLSSAEALTISTNPWVLWGSPYRRILVGATSGATTHTTTGALAGGSSAVAGTAAHRAKHVTTGALTGAGTTVVGVAHRTRVHANTGVLVGTSSAVVGTATRASGAVIHATSGALTGSGATLAGTAHRTRLHANTGALTGPGSSAAGTARHQAKHVTSGVLPGSVASLAGVAHRTRLHATSGAFPGQTATIVGAASRASAGTHPTAGVLIGPGSALAGTAHHTAKHATTGALAGSGSAIAGTAVHKAKHVTSGVLTGAGAFVVGTAARSGAAVSHSTSGVLVGNAGGTGGGSTVMTGGSYHSVPGGAVKLPPPPPTNDFKSPVWQDWFYKLMTRASTGVYTFNLRNGAVTLTSADVVAALGYTPAATVTATQHTFAYGDASPATITTVPAGKAVLAVELFITEAFDGTGATLTVGDAGVADRLMSAVENDPTLVGEFFTSPAHTYAGSTAVNLTITPGAGASQGKGVVNLYVQQ